MPSRPLEALHHANTYLILTISDFVVSFATCSSPSDQDILPHPGVCQGPQILGPLWPFGCWPKLALAFPFL